MFKHISQVRESQSGFKTLYKVKQIYISFYFWLSYKVYVGLKARTVREQEQIERPKY